MNKDLCLLSDFICLIYHEARYIRSSIQAGKLPQHPKYDRLCSLPGNRDKAWQEMTAVREKAAQAQSAEEVARIYQKAYSLTLQNLCDLLQKPIWINYVGGGRWVEICGKIGQLLKAMKSGDEATINHLLGAIPEMSHNTGKLKRKLKQLGPGRD